MRDPRYGLVLWLLLTTGAVAGTPRTWEYRDNRWQETAAPATAPAADPIVDRTEQLLDARQYDAARKLAIQWLKSHKDSPLRDRALLVVARGFYHGDDRIRAFYYCDELMDECPDSPLFYRALELQYNIADAFLNGYKRRFLFFPLSSEDEAVEMLFRIQQRSPGSPLAEKSLRRTADYYYADAQYDLAGDAYGAYVRSYPRSPYVPRMKLRQAFANYAQFRGVRFDPTPLMDARAQLADMVGAYPELAQEENLPAIIQRIDATFARKIYVTADFYRRTHEPRAAVYTYRFVKNVFPNSQEAAMAGKALDKMPRWALNEPGPAPSNGYIPTTAPTAEAR